MIHKTASTNSGQIRVTFELPACVWADQVFLVGDFNDWNESATPFRQDRNGVWRASMDLPAGQRYHFRYLVDGSWRTDYHADGHEDNGLQSTNSILETVLPEDSRAILFAHPSSVHEKHKIAVSESFRQQRPPNRLAA